MYLVVAAAAHRRLQAAVVQTVEAAAHPLKAVVAQLRALAEEVAAPQEVELFQEHRVAETVE